MLMAIKHGIERFLIIVTSLMLAAMLGLAIWQVTSRYILKSPAIYTEETLRFVMIWMGLLGSVYAFGTGQHLQLVFLGEWLKERGRKIVATANGLIVMFFSLIIMLLGGIRMTASGMDQISPILNVKMGYVYAILPVSAVIIAVLQAINLCLLWRRDDSA